MDEQEKPLSNSARRKYSHRYKVGEAEEEVYFDTCDEMMKFLVAERDKRQKQSETANIETVASHVVLPPKELQ